MSIVMLIAGLYLILLASMMSTHNIRAAVFFKFLPYVLGVLLIVGVVADQGWITINDSALRTFFTTWW